MFDDAKFLKGLARVVRDDGSVWWVDPNRAAVDAQPDAALLAEFARLEKLHQFIRAREARFQKGRA